jgi:hypothetical protein
MQAATSIDDHSRFVVVAAGRALPSERLTAPPDALRNHDAAEPIRSTATTGIGDANSGLRLLPSAGAVEFDSVIAVSDLLALIPAVRLITSGPSPGEATRARLGRRIHRPHPHRRRIGQDDALHPDRRRPPRSERGAHQAGPSPATPSVARDATLSAATVIEVGRIVDSSGNADWPSISPEKPKGECR